MALKGKDTVIQVSTDDADYNTIAELNDATMSFAGNNIDITEFGDDFINRIQGLKDNTFSLAGFYAPEDTTGQVVIRDGWLNDEDLYVQFLHDGANGFKQQVRVSTFEVSAAVDGAQEVSIEFEGTDAVTAVS